MHTYVVLSAAHSCVVESSLDVLYVVTQYVTESFNSSSLFHKALKEAFEAFCNKQVGGLASAELMANFCNTLLTKARRLRTFCLTLMSMWMPLPCASSPVLLHLFSITRWKATQQRQDGLVTVRVWLADAQGFHTGCMLACEPLPKRAVWQEYT